MGVGYATTVSWAWRNVKASDINSGRLPYGRPFPEKFLVISNREISTREHKQKPAL